MTLYLVCSSCIDNMENKHSEKYNELNNINNARTSNKKKTIVIMIIFHVILKTKCPLDNKCLIDNIIYKATNRNKRY